LLWRFAIAGNECKYYKQIFHDGSTNLGHFSGL